MMRRISIDYDLSINIYNKNGKKEIDDDEPLFNEQIFLLPHSSNGSHIHNKIDLLYGGIVSFLNINPKGVECHGVSFFSQKFAEDTIKDKNDVEKKVDEYLKQTPTQIKSDRPITIVYIDHLKDSMEEAEGLGVKTYKDLFIIKNAEEMRQKYYDAIAVANKKMKEWYNPDTEKGQKNIASEANMRMYFGGGPELLRKAGELFHPNGGEMFKYE